VILEAIQLLKDTVSPSEDTTHREYRISLAVSFLFNFLSALANSSNAPSNIDTPTESYTNGTTNGSTVDSPEKHVKVDSNDLPIRSRQEMVSSDEYKPVGKPIKKVGAEIQASGIYSYTDA
jgi:indole-3-acetaldehyde oxidase